MRIQRRSFRIAALLLGSVLALLAGELAARLILDNGPLFARADRWIAHERLGGVLRPNHAYTARGESYRTNRIHLRDRDFAPVPERGVTRVAVVGDSFVFGVGPLDETIAKVLEARLGDTFEVMAVGLPGYGTIRQNRFLEEFLDEYRFDVVILAFCVGNDILENARMLVRGEDATWLRPRERGLLRRHSYLYAALHRVVRDPARARKSRFLEHVETRIRLARPRYYEAPEGAAAYARTLSEIDGMRSWAEERGAVFAVALLPEEYQIDPDLRRQVRTSLDLPEEGVETDLVQVRMREDLARAGTPVIDPLPAFRAQARDAALFIPQDTHFDTAGNQIVAEALHGWIAARNLTGSTAR